MALTLPLPVARLLAIVALEPSGVHRSQVAQELWPHGTQARGAANLRSALWQVRRSPATPALHVAGPRLRLDAAVTVDVHSVPHRVATVLRSTEGPVVDLIGHLRRDLLPGWDDGWLAAHRDRWSVTRRHALDELAAGLRRQRRFAEALRAAHESVALDPMREVPHRLIVEVHLAEGDRLSALDHYQRYADLLGTHHRLPPSPLMEELLRSPARPPRRTAPVGSALDRAETVFHLLDENGDGRVEADDLRRMSKRVLDAADGSSEEDKAAVRTAFDRYWAALSADLDDDRDGRVSLYEFTSCILSPERFGAVITEFAESLATLGDPDGDGLVARPRLRRLLLAIGFGRDNVEALFDALEPSDSDHVTVRAWADAITEYCHPAKSGTPADLLVDDRGSDVG